MKGFGGNCPRTLKRVLRRKDDSQKKLSKKKPRHVSIILATTHTKTQFRNMKTRDDKKKVTRTFLVNSSRRKNEGPINKKRPQQFLTVNYVQYRSEIKLRA